MANKTQCDIYKILVKKNDWLNAIQLALAVKRGERTCRENCQLLVDGGAVERRVVDKRHYFKVIADVEKREALPIVIDIKDTNRIKRKGK